MFDAGASTIPIWWPNGPFMPGRANWDGGAEDWKAHADTLSLTQISQFAASLPESVD